jgi:RHS repeat-associated protein
MTDVNKNQMGTSDLGGKLFSYKIKYTNREGVENPDTAQFSGKNVLPKYNGNIVEIDWRAIETLGATPSLTPKRYGYAYDKLNRLTAGFYQNPNNPTSKENTESLAYDVNGNITNLYRTSILEYGNTTPTLVDNLEYIYASGNNSNRLTNINDYSYNATGYEGGGQTISYDINGNMIDMPDKTLAIKYNYLNLPNKVDYSKNENEYVTVNTKYDAEGEKLQKENNTTIIGFSGYTTTKRIIDYLDGFQYLHVVTPPDPGGGGSESLMANSETSRALEMQAYSLDEPVMAFGTMGVKTADLQFFPTAEGFYDYQKNQYIYQYEDHLGNVRVSFAKNSAGVLELVDNNDYYPFGMNHLKTGVSYFGQGSYKNYKYNGKELQESGMYDYGARMYMADLGRWVQVDPLLNDLSFTFNPNDIESSNISAGILLSNGGGIFNTNNLNPYMYGYSNPIRFNDPDGRCPNCLTALGGALIGGGLELGGQLLSGKSLDEVDWADVGVETLKGGLIGSGVGAGAALAIEAGSVATKASIDYSAKDGNQNVFNGKKSLGKATMDATMDVVAGQAGKYAAKGLNSVASKALTKATTAEAKAATVLTRTTNTFNRITANGSNVYGSRALLAQKRMGIAQSGIKFARKNTAAAKLVKTAVKNGEVVNKAVQNSISDKIKAFFGFN